MCLLIWTVCQVSDVAHGPLICIKPGRWAMWPMGLLFVLSQVMCSTWYVYLTFRSDVSRTQFMQTLYIMRPLNSLNKRKQFPYLLPLSSPMYATLHNSISESSQSKNHQISSVLTNLIILCYMLNVCCRIPALEILTY